ncbi:MAG: HEAT repeat domain-containing protein [Planctomycetota bacterium]|nr:HEAT repeat domain-containing protein [Planctomycetota bacterium]MDA1211156.1 HEAT repeat domain-containing protein [Planctomycetota bacterium]
MNSAPISSSQPEAFTIVLEPRDGGGDLQLHQASGRIVEQIKARSDGGTWSLREIIEDVFPDLFLAVDATVSNVSTFRFVTEGRMGSWRQVYETFFRTLRSRGTLDDPLDHLDDNVPIRLRLKSDTTETFFPLPITERSLFLKIADVISERSAVKKLNLNNRELYLRVRELVGGFEFVGGQDLQSVQQSIDALLLAIVDKHDDIPRIRDHLAMELAKASTIGGAVIDANKFLSDHGLDATPLTDWTNHIGSARCLVSRATERIGYDENVDVRLAELPVAPHTGEILVLTGESGAGKTWTVNALAKRATGPLLPILVESEGTAEATLKKCAEVFWNEIHDGDEVLPLSRIIKRLKKLTNSDVGLAVFVDGVVTYEEARRLIEQDWRALSSSLVVALPPKYAKNLQAAYPNRFHVYECRDFSWEELHDYVDRRLETGWAEIPIDVREPLRKPLLARIYCEQLGEMGWNASTEYELYQSVWNRLTNGPQSDWPLDLGYVENLARGAREGAPYPWSPRQLVDAGIDNQALARLMGVGWLIAVGDSYRIFHDRLLQWAVAQTLCGDFRTGRITAEAVVEFVAKQVRIQSGDQDAFLDYVPMDVLWGLSRGNEQHVDLCIRILESLENANTRYAELLYDKLVPTLGACIADAVYGRLCSFVGQPWILKRIMRCLSVVGRDRIETFARPLIESDDYEEQRRGVNLLRLAPCPTLLDHLWTIHVTAQRDPTLFGEQVKNALLLYRETFDALRQSVREAPQWLVNAIKCAEPATEPVHDLGYLVANANDGGRTWYLVKAMLFEKTRAEKPRSLVANIARYRDTSETGWLHQWIGSKIDLVSAPALQALSRLAPDAAVAGLSRTDPMEVNLWRNSAFTEIFERRRLETHAALLEWMQRSDDPWKIALAFQNRENDISTAMLEIAIDALGRVLDAKLRGDADSCNVLHRELAFIAKLAAPEHLQVLRARRGTSFERVLRDYVLRIGPQLGQWATGIERDPAIAILNLIGGDGLTAVTNEFLIRGDQYGKHAALEWSSRRSDALTIERLRQITLSDECWPGGGDVPVVQDEAMKILAQLGRWEFVAEGIKKWGMKTSPDLKRAPRPITDVWTESLRQTVEQTPTVGSVIALGVVGSEEDCSRLHAILDQCDPNSELAHACIISLESLNDCSKEGVARVSDHLKVGKQRFSAIQMLQNAGTPDAWAALYEDLQVHFDFVTAINLINLTEYHDVVAEIALSHIPNHRWIDGYSFLKLFLTEIRPAEVRTKVFQDSRVRELFHHACADAEGPSWCVGSKANAIQCLAEFDPEAAFAAACRALEDDEAHDRELYPSILMKIDEIRAIQWLVMQYPREKSQLVRVAVGRALENRIPDSTVFHLMRDEIEIVRTAGAELAGWAMLEDAIDDALTNILDDSSDDVVRAAIVAKQQRRDRRRVIDLTRLIIEEKDPNEQLVYFDALVGFVDPGDAHRPLHPFLQQALQAVSEFEAKRAIDKLKKRRKKLHDELRKVKL